jgi:hypothetical protein
MDLNSDEVDWKVAPEVASLTGGELVVKEKMTVQQLKELIFSQWDVVVGAHKSAVASPKSPQHIRVRDGQSGGQSGPLRDARILGRSLVGLADGRKLIIQVTTI